MLKEIQSKSGNCQISFPKQETGETLVTLRGHKENVDMAKKLIQEIVDEQVSQHNSQK